MYVKNIRDRRMQQAARTLVGLIVLLAAAGGAAQECDVPLFVQQSIQGANVMILADNSGSMNQAMYHHRYRWQEHYAGDFDPDQTYFVTKNGKKTPKDFNWAFEGTATANMIQSDNGQPARYTGNYLNWLYYHATDEERAEIPQVTRIQVLKQVLCEIMDQSSARLKFGLTVFQHDHGGSVIGKCGVNATSLKAQINGMTANTWTPLGESMETVLDYFAYDGPDAAIEEPCQFNFVLVVTDGLPTMDEDVSAYLWDADSDGEDPGNCASIGAPYPETNHCTGHFDDVAYHMAHMDLRNDMEDDQFAYTYVVGFHEQGNLLREAAQNGKGLFFFAENAVDLFLSIELAIQDIMKKISAGSAVAVISTEEHADDRLFRGKFMPVDWTGFLESHALPYESGQDPLWEAGQIMEERGPNSRNIFTAIGAEVIPFTEGYAGDLQEYMEAADLVEAAQLIAWGRGEDVAGLRDRHGWILGDIVHATPVVVASPVNFLAEQAYQEFYAANENRQKMVYVGANDGMLHAFNADSGDEEWAFVPEFALPTFNVMADSFYCHTYSCDQTATIADLKIGGIWKTVLVAGGGKGGAGLFAMDITEPGNPDLMWQAELPGGLSNASEVEIGSIGGQAVALIGSGLDETGGNAYLFCYHVSSGNLVGTASLGVTKSRNKATRPEAVDLDLDGQTDLVYVADLSGSVWRIALNESPYAGLWNITELYSGTEEITASPTAAAGIDGDIYVYFGTGAYLTEDDMVTSEQHYFSCVYDDHGGATATQKDLTNQTATISDVGNDRGWYVELWNQPGERVTQQAAVVAETAIFTSFAPTLNACSAGGQSWLYQMDYKTGSHETMLGMDNPEDRSAYLGQGLASYPVVDLAAGQVVIQSSDAAIHVHNVASIFQRIIVKSWQEAFEQTFVVFD